MTVLNMLHVLEIHAQAIHTYEDQQKHDTGFTFLHHSHVPCQVPWTAALQFKCGQEYLSYLTYQSGLSHLDMTSNCATRQFALVKGIRCLEHNSCFRASRG
jgi:hypothetical protein